MQFSLVLATLLSTAMASPAMAGADAADAVAMQKMSMTNMDAMMKEIDDATELAKSKMAMADAQDATMMAKRQGAGGLTLGGLLSLVDKLIEKVGETSDDLKEPADKLSGAISDFEDAAKDVDIPEASASS